jgi:hypothetical protein
MANSAAMVVAVPVTAYMADRLGGQKHFLIACMVIAFCVSGGIPGAITYADPWMHCQFRGQNISGPRRQFLRRGFEHQTYHRGQTSINLYLHGIIPLQEPF